MTGGSDGAVPGTREWLARPVLEVAPALLGARVTTHLDGATVTVRLTEVEAYDGQDDPGSHAFRGETARNTVMFGTAGHLYVYRHMGLHHCVNVVTGVEGRPSAVLLRAGEVVDGQDVARSRRQRSGVARTDRDLARGPARLAVALGLDLSMAGIDLFDPAGAVRLIAHPAVLDHCTGPRVGVAGAGGRADLFPWRFWLPGEPTVSVFRPGASRRRRNGAPVRGAGTAH